MNMKNIWNFALIRGKGKSPRDGACLLDAVSWFEYGRLGDHPPCVCPVIAAYGRGMAECKKVADVVSAVDRLPLPYLVFPPHVAAASAVAYADAVVARSSVGVQLRSEMYTTAISIFGGMLEIGRSSETAPERWATASGQFAEAMQSS